MRLRVVCSGSKGNAYILTQDDGRSLLLDAGGSFDKIEATLGRDWPLLRGALITHEHNDHAKNVKKLLERGIPVYMSNTTRLNLHTLGAIPVMENESVEIKSFSEAYTRERGIFVKPFMVQHDVEAFGYVIQDPKTQERFVYLTDSYYLAYKIDGVHYWLIECNYVDEALEGVNKTLARRLDGSHMSLDRLVNTMRESDTSRTKKIILCHLSDQRSDEARMIREVTEATGISTVAADAGMDIPLRIIPF